MVFNSIDREQTGGITFGDFMDFLSVLTKGSEEEKILWSFQFYDVNRDGIISRDEMIKVSIMIISKGAFKYYSSVKGGGGPTPIAELGASGVLDQTADVILEYIIKKRDSLRN